MPNNTSNVNSTNGPVVSPTAALGKLKVAQIKRELKMRNVSFPSKLRKEQLLALLSSSPHLPVRHQTEGAEDDTPGSGDEEKPLEWNEHHPARKLLCDELLKGNVPLCLDAMGPAEVYHNCSGTFEFQIKGMEHGATFARRLRDLRKQASGDEGQAAQDEIALKRAIDNHPVPLKNHRGEPQWNGSEAQRLLKEDIAAGKQLGLTPSKPRLE